MTYIGLPRPRPLGPPGGPPASALGFFIVSSTERIKQAASEAAVRALILMTAGSHTQASKLSEMSSFTMFTPYQVPSENEGMQIHLVTVVKTTTSGVGFRENLMSKD